MLGFGLLAAVLSVSAQSVPPVSGRSAAGTASSPGAQENVVQLSAFEVSTEKDKGYSSSQAVGATRMAVPLAEIPQAIVVLNEALIQDVQAMTIDDVAKFTSSFTRDGAPMEGVDHSPTIRGVSPTVFTDGLPETGRLDLSVYNRIEILKGPSAVIYGSTASGGVINRTTKKPDFARRHGSIDFLIGSWDDYRAGIDYTQPLGQEKRFSYRVVASYYDRKSWQDFFYDRKRVIAPMFGWRPTDRTTILVQIQDYHDKSAKIWGELFTLPPYTGTPSNPLRLSLGLDLPRGRTWAEPYSYNLEQNRRYSTSIDQKVSDTWSLRFTGSYTDYMNTEYTTIPRDMVVATPVRLMQRSWRNAFNPAESAVGALDSAWKFNLGKTRHNLISLAQYQENKSGATQYLGRSLTGNTTDVLARLDIYNPVYGAQPPQTFLSSSTRSKGTNFGTAVQEQAYLFGDKLILQAGVRYNRNTSQGTNALTGVVGAKGARTKTQPRYGVVYRPIAGVSLYVSRSGTFTPQYGTQPDGTPFRPVESDQDEIGVKFELLQGKVSALISHFKRDDKNLIILDPDPARASLGFRLQIPGDKLSGSEIDLFLNPVDGVQVIIGASKFSPQNLSGVLTRGIPREMLGGLVKYDFSRWVKNLAAGVGYSYQARRPGDAANSFFLDSFGVWEAFVSYRRGARRYNLKVDNLEDKYYAASAVNRNVIKAGKLRGITFRVTQEF